jgi:Flp pilus assembly protein TadB
MGLLAAAVCLGLAWWLGRPATGPAGRAPRRPRQRARLPEPARLARPAALSLAAAVGLLVHPVAGALAAAFGWWAAPAAVARLESPGQAARRELLGRQLPLVAELLAACLAAGTTLSTALRIVADGVPEPSRGVLDAAARCASLGGSAQEVAELLAGPADPAWQALAAAVPRSAATGAPLAGLLVKEADRARAAWSAGAAARARAVGVRIVLPLAALSLPAFVLLTVVPVVAGFLTAMAP